jgi:hypothetical protein
MAAAQTARERQAAHWHSRRFRTQACVYCECLALLHEAAIAFCDQNT